MARERDPTMETPTCQSIEVKKNVEINASVLAHHLVVKEIIGEAMVKMMEIPSKRT